MALADKVIEQAEKWVGYLEKKSNSQLESLTANAGYNNYTVFTRDYENIFDENGYQPCAWCAIFVSMMLYYGCGNKEIVEHFAYCPYGVNDFKQNGQWHTSKPKRGDVIFFKDSSGVACHVGLVSSVGANTVVTIEGNTSSSAGVVANGGCVAKKSYNLKYSRILGYGRPPYEKYEAVTPSKDDEYMVEKKAMQIDGKMYNINSIEKDDENYIRMRDLIQAGYVIGYDGNTNTAQLRAPKTRIVEESEKEKFNLMFDELKAKFGLEEQTIEYIFKYMYGSDLIEKLLK